MSSLPDEIDDNPSLLGIVLCERVLQDVLRRDAISCINIYSGIAAAAFPAVIPLVYAFAQLSGCAHQFSYQFRIEDDAGEFIAGSTVVNVDPLPNRHTPHKIVTAFSGLTFDNPGLYHVILEVEGEQVGSLPFHVNQAP
ncbi:MAG: hypothetical protein JSS86_14345 [Cyanobacteria bacterium SZAS LIN-2]|nr:hypothetical protein [Cyanobacteria bacterium SZAS LIN-3]MBS1997496.1 hypothetical protein [Cyanobacteria bacterium SZAS LIN-2]MBS2005511.1 hypothetical protein [Cyanobacteria bacterium SZAS TMP-1]